MLLLTSVPRGWAQGVAGTIGDFLNYPVTPEMAAMGDGGVSIVTNSAISAIANPAQLGMLSMTNSLSIGTGFDMHTDTPLNRNFGTAFGFRDASFSVSAVSYGARLNSLWEALPSYVGLGLQYSYEKFASPSPVTLSVSPFIIGNEAEHANAFTIGLGIHYFLRLGLGYSVKFIGGENGYYISNLDQTARDFGAILQIPVLRLLHGSRDGSFILGEDIQPIFNITAGYSLRNVGGYVHVVRPLSGEVPLARQANLGWNWRLAFQSKVAGFKWDWFSFTWDREAANSPFNTDSSLVTNPNGYSYWNYFWSYSSGLGSFSPWSNLIVGRGSASVAVSKGWQIGLGEFLYLRGGSLTNLSQNPWSSTFPTSGWGVKLDGLVKALVFLHGLNANDSFTRFILHHFNLEFDYSTASGGVFDAIKPFESLNLALR